MGTRGVWGFRKDGKDKLTYNHFDSYPESLGVTVLDFCKKNSLERLGRIFDGIILVNEEDKPTKQQIKECIYYFDDRVSTKKPTEWYALLRDSQGNPEAYINGLNYMIDGAGFIKESLFCEYGYIINLDDKVFEVYVGFNKTSGKSRYCDGKDNGRGYYPCILLTTFPLPISDLLDRQSFLTAFNEADKIARPEYHEDDEE